MRQEILCQKTKKPDKSGRKILKKNPPLSTTASRKMTCLADKTNHPVERLSLNRSQCGSCSTKYDTSADTEVVYNGFGASTLLNGCSGKASALQALAQVPESGMEAEAYPSPHKKDAQQ